MVVVDTTAWEHAIKNPGARYTVVSHGGSHAVVPQTARTDLQGLEREGFLIRIASKRDMPAAGVGDQFRFGRETNSTPRHTLGWDDLD